MRHAWFVIVMLAGCHKKAPSGEKDPAPPPVPPAYEDAGIRVETSGAMATKAATAALDDYDRWIAPIFSLTPHQRFAEICKARTVLATKAQAISVLAAPGGTATAAWQAAVGSLPGSVAAIDMCCAQNKTTDQDPNAPSAEDDRNADCAENVHTTFKTAALLVPGLKPDAHAHEPLMVAPAPRKVDMSATLATLRAVDAELGAASTAAAEAKTPKDVCGATSASLEHIKHAINDPDLATPPGREPDWRDARDDLTRGIGALDALCGRDPADLKATQLTVAHLREPLQRLLAIGAGAPP